MAADTGLDQLPEGYKAFRAAMRDAGLSADAPPGYGPPAGARLSAVGINIRIKPGRDDLKTRIRALAAAHAPNLPLYFDERSDEPRLSESGGA